MKMIYRLAAVAAVLPLTFAALPAAAQANDAYATANLNSAGAAPITAAEVEAAQRDWGDALVAISTEYDHKGQAAARALAGQVIDAAYGYNLGPVAFKPTLAAPPTTFRTTREGALSYFVGGDSRYPGDTGFALKHWRSYQIDNAVIVINGATALSMGNVMLTDADGKVTTVDKTWGFVRDPQGRLRIVLHHSSLPYTVR